MGGSHGEKEVEENREQSQDIDFQKQSMISDTELEMDQEMTQSEMEQEDHELHEILDKEHLDLEGFLIQGTMGGVDRYHKEVSTKYNSCLYGELRIRGGEGEKH